MVIVENYGKEEFQSITLYDVPDINTIGGKINKIIWLVFVPGGGWRDPEYTCDDGKTLMSKCIKLLGEESEKRNIIWASAGINYRKSLKNSNIKYPIHELDVAIGLDYLYKNYGMTNYILIGHSAGGFISLNIPKYVWKDMIPSFPLGIICVNGIYDLKSLIKEYPDYLDMIESGFGSDKEVWDEASPGSLGKVYRKTIGGGKDGNNVNNLKGEGFNLATYYNGLIGIIHSDEDDLLSWEQPQSFINNCLKCDKIDKVSYMVYHSKGKHRETLNLDITSDLVFNFVSNLISSIDYLKANESININEDNRSVALWLQPPSSSIFYEKFVDGIKEISTLDFCTGGYFPPHITIISKIPLKTNDFRKIVEDIVMYSRSLNLHVYLEGVKFSPEFFKKGYIEVSKEESTGLVELARYAKEKYGNSLKEDSLQWAKDEYKPHLSLLYSDVWPIGNENERKIENIYKEIKDTIGKMEWKGGRIAIVDCNQPISNWKPIFEIDI